MARKTGLGRGLAALLGELDETRSAVSETATADASTTATAVAQADALAPASEGHGVVATPAGGAGVVDIPVGSIRRNPRQPRRAFDVTALDELASSIAAVGVVQPVIVRQTDEGYELIAGERRWRAAQKAGFTVVPAILRKASDVESLELALIFARIFACPTDEIFQLESQP